MFGRMMRALLVTALVLNSAAPWVPIAGAAPIDTAQSQHHGHDMPDMAMDDAPGGQPATDCCDDGSMDCRCGCIVSQPGAPHFITLILTGGGAPEPAVVVSSRHIPKRITTPFRPPA